VLRAASSSSDTATSSLALTDADPARHTFAPKWTPFKTTAEQQPTESPAPGSSQANRETRARPRGLARITRELVSDDGRSIAEF